MLSRGGERDVTDTQSFLSFIFLSVREKGVRGGGGSMTVYSVSAKGSGRQKHFETKEKRVTK